MQILDFLIPLLQLDQLKRTLASICIKTVSISDVYRGSKCTYTLHRPCSVAVGRLDTISVRLFVLIVIGMTVWPIRGYLEEIVVHLTYFFDLAMATLT